MYTNKETVVPQKWEDSDPRYTTNSHKVKLRCFTTSVHKAESMATYKEDDHMLIQFKLHLLSRTFTKNTSSPSFSEILFILFLFEFPLSLASHS